MKTKTILSRLAATAALLIATTSLYAADVSGTYSWSTPGRNGGPERVSTLTLKADGAKLEGKLSTPGRDGKPTDTAITEGKVDGESVSFSVVREFNGNSITTKYSGKAAADKITGKAETTREGQAQSRDWEAKRVKETK